MSRDSEVARIEAALSDVLSYTNYDDDTAQKLYDAGLRRSTSRDSEVRAAIEAELAKQRSLPALMRSSGYESGIGFVLRILDAHASEEAECGYNEPHEPHEYVVALNDLPVDLACPGLASEAATNPTASSSGLVPEAAPTPHIDDIPGPHPESPDWHRGYRAGRTEAAPVVGLSEAWAKAEAALPEGWFLHGVKRGYVGANATPSGPRWSASAIQGGIGVDTRHHGTVPSQNGSGPTPTEALLNLAARLTQTRTLGETKP